jgi:hypothetical protein
MPIFVAYADCSTIVATASAIAKKSMTDENLALIFSFLEVNFGTQNKNIRTLFIRQRKTSTL